MVTGEHTLQKYDVELEQMRSRILQMGGLAESQFKLAMEAFEAADVEKADLAIANDRRLNELQLDLDMMVNHLIARRQPTAGDLRMVMGVAKTITDLERIGDEAAKIGRASKWLKEKGSGFRMNRIPDLHQSGEIAARMLHRSLDAFARLDGHAAASIIRETAHPDANLIFGAVVDESMGDELRITVIATGFEGVSMTRRQVLEQHYSQPRPQPAQPSEVSVEQRPAADPEPVQSRFAPNNLEIPAFLRRK